MTKFSRNFILSTAYFFICSLLVACGATNSDNSSGSSGAASSSSSSSGSPVDHLYKVSFTSMAKISVLEGDTKGVYKPDISGLPNSENWVRFDISGEDSEAFSIDANSGELSFVHAPMFDSPQDFDRDNIYKVFLRVSSERGDFAEASIELSFQIVKTSAVTMGELQVLFPPDQSYLDLGEETQLDLIVRVLLKSGNSANIISVLANSVELTKSSLEDGLWLGKIPVSKGEQTIQYEVIDSTNETFHYSSLVTNDSATLDLSHLQGYEANDLDFDGGTLAMVSSSQVFLWDPTDLSTQRNWQFIKPYLVYNVPKYYFNYQSFYTKQNLGGIELNLAENYYFVYMAEVKQDDWIITEDFYLLKKNLMGHTLSSSQVGQTRNNTISFPASPYLGEFRINSDMEETFFSQKSVLYLERRAYERGRPEIQGDASVEGNIGIYVKGGELGKTYLDTKVSTPISQNQATTSIANYIAVTHNPKNYLAYALSAPNQNERRKQLYAISLLSGQRVVLGGGTPLELNDSPMAPKEP